MPYSKLENPQSLNLYAYVTNNPSTLVDVDGHQDDLRGKCEECKAMLDAISHGMDPSDALVAGQSGQLQSTTSNVIHAVKTAVTKFENAKATIQKWTAAHPYIMAGAMVGMAILSRGASAEGEGAGVEGIEAGEGLPYSDRVKARSAEDPGPNHNFPSSFDKVIIQNGQKTVGSDGYTQYNLRGSANGQEGTYEIGVKGGQIEHRFFRPDN